MYGLYGQFVQRNFTIKTGMKHRSGILILIAFVLAGCSDSVSIDEAASFEDPAGRLAEEPSHYLSAEESGLGVPFKGYGVTDQEFEEALEHMKVRWEGSDFLERADEFAPSSSDIRSGALNNDLGKTPGNTGSWFLAGGEHDFWIYDWTAELPFYDIGRLRTTICYIHRYEGFSGAECENGGCIVHRTLIPYEMTDRVMIDVGEWGARENVAILHHSGTLIQHAPEWEVWMTK